MVTAAVIALWATGIEARLIYLQVIDHAELLQRAERQWSRTREVPPKRGDLIDRVDGDDHCDDGYRQRKKFEHRASGERRARDVNRSAWRSVAIP